MPLIFMDRIEEHHLRNHPDWRFLFGDNELRQGRGGQAATCRGHANAIGIATKRAPERSERAFWSDADYDRLVAIIDADLAPAFDHVRQGGTVVCPSAGLGTGLSELPTRAPRVFAYLRQRIIALKKTGIPDKPVAASPATRIPRVLNKKTDRIPPDAYYCGRPSPLGNPFVIGRDGARDDVCDKFEAWLPTQQKLMTMLPGLAGRDLVCFCAPLRCHCDTALRLANPELACR